MISHSRRKALRKLLFFFPPVGLYTSASLIDGNTDMCISQFSLYGSPVSSTYKKNEFKVEFQLLTDVESKSLLAKVGYFDIVTVE